MEDIFNPQSVVHFSIKSASLFWFLIVIFPREQVTLSFLFSLELTKANASDKYKQHTDFD